MRSTKRSVTTCKWVSPFWVIDPQDRTVKIYGARAGRGHRTGSDTQELTREPHLKRLPRPAASGSSLDPVVWHRADGQGPPCRAKPQAAILSLPAAASPPAAVSLPGADVLGPQPLVLLRRQAF